MSYVIIVSIGGFVMRVKSLAIMLVLSIMLLSFSACGKMNEKRVTEERRQNLKIGLLLAGEENDSYNNLHIDGLTVAKTSFEISEEKVVVKHTTEEEAYRTLVKLIEEGCNLIFAAGDGIEEYVIQAATENESIDFCYADGYKAKEIGLANYHNYGVSTYQARYLSGIVAGYKLNEMIENGEIDESRLKIGYIGTVPDSRVRSDFTAFYLGVKSICPTVNMFVHYSGSENSIESETISAKVLMANGAILISQQSYNNDVAAICEEYGRVFVGNAVPAFDVAPNAFLVSAQVDWTASYADAIETHIKEGKLPTDWCSGVLEDSVGISNINSKAFTDESKVDEVKSKVEENTKLLKDGSIKVFDTTVWTVNGKKIHTTATEELLDIYNGIEYISPPGYFAECTLNSYPGFNFIIDGIVEFK